MDMEAHRRRLAVLSSHLRPPLIHSINSQFVSASNCSSQSRDDEFQTPKLKQNAALRGDCVFCRIIDGQSRAFKIYEDDTCLCILDINPLSLGHSLLIPKFHFCSLDATPPSVIAAMCSKIPIISDAIKKATECDSFNLLVNNGAAAGQVIFHTHIHIIPRKACDRLWASESLRRLSLKLDEEASQLAESIRQHLSIASKGEDFKGQRSNLASDFQD